jgi:hypothetical protein
MGLLDFPDDFLRLIRYAPPNRDPTAGLDADSVNDPLSWMPRRQQQEPPLSLAGPGFTDDSTASSPSWDRAAVSRPPLHVSWPPVAPRAPTGPNCARPGGGRYVLRRCVPGVPRSWSPNAHVPKRFCDLRKGIFHHIGARYLGRSKALAAPSSIQLGGTNGRRRVRESP